MINDLMLFKVDLKKETNEGCASNETIWSQSSKSIINNADILWNFISYLIKIIYFSSFSHLPSSANISVL